jgi:competence protein ComEC
VTERPVPRRRAALTVAALAVWAATAATTLVSPGAATVVAACAAVPAAVVGAVLRRWPLVVAAALGVACGAASAAWHLKQLRDGPIPALAARHAEVHLVARLVRDPAVVTTAGGVAMTIADATASSVDSGVSRSVDAPILVLSYQPGWAGLLPGQRIELTGRLQSPRAGDDVAAVMDARGPLILVGRPPWWQRFAGRVRRGLLAACRGLPADARGLVPGLVDGDISAVPLSLQADLRTTGLTHLQAVSGENVSIVIGVVLAVCRAAGLRRWARVLVAGAALVGFVVVARPSPSVLRAAVMGAVVLLAMLAGRPVAPLRALSAAVVILLCVDPFLARSAGFALSVCATAGLLLLAPRWSRWLAQRLPAGVAAAVAVPAAAQFACTPILVLAFGQLTPYAIPANLLAVVAVPVATVLGVTCAASAAVCVPLAVPVGWLAALPAEWIALVARSLARLPGAGLSVGHAATVVLLLVVVGVAAVTTLAAVRRAHRRDMLGPWRP